MAAVSSTEIQDRAAALREHVERIERVGHAGLGFALEPVDVALLAVMCAAADVLDRLAGEQEA